MKNEFSTFFDTLAWLYVFENDFAPIADLAGVDWFKLPDCESVKAVREYLELRATKSHEIAKREIAPALRVYESYVEPKLVSRDHQLLTYDLKRHLDAAQLLELSKRIQANPYNGAALIQSFETIGVDSIESASAGDLIPVMVAEHLEKIKTNQAVIKIPTFEKLSQMIGGFNPGRLIMLLGETGFGKTNLGINLAGAAASQSQVGFVNMELSYEDVVSRIFCIMTGTPYLDYQQGKINQNHIHELCHLLGDRLHVTSGRSLSLSMIEAWVRAKKDLKFLFIDYDQKLDIPLDRYTQEWKAVQKAIIKLEDLAKELNFCCVVFAQVNREGEVSASHRATFSAHTVLSFQDHHERGPLIAAKKNRHGKKGAAIVVNYDEETSRVKEQQIISMKDLDSIKEPRRLQKKISGGNQNAYQGPGASHD